MKLFYSIFFTLLVPLSVQAEAQGTVAATETLTLEGLVQQVLASNPELAFYEAELAAAKGERTSAGQWPNPELSAQAGRKELHDRSGSMAGEGAAWSVSVMQPFEFPGRLELRKAIASKQVELAELGLDRFRHALASRARWLGYRLIAEQQRAQAAQQVAARGQELVSVLIQRDPAGVTPLIEARIIEASVATQRQAAAEAVESAESARYELNQLRGAPYTAPVPLVREPLELPDLPPIDELLRVAATNNFQLRMRAAELEQQGFRVELAKNERWPAITAGPFYSEERAGEKEQVLGLGISIPLPLWNRNRGEIAAAEARQTQAETALQLAQRQLEREVREHALGYTLKRVALGQSRTNILQEMENAAELADRHYRLGAVPVSTYVEAQEKYGEALQSTLSARIAALDHLQEMELLTGLKLREP